MQSVIGRGSNGVTYRVHSLFYFTLCPHLKGSLINKSSKFATLTQIRLLKAASKMLACRIWAPYSVVIIHRSKLTKIALWKLQKQTMDRRPFFVEQCPFIPV